MGISAEIFEAVQRDGYFIVPKSYVYDGDILYKDGVPSMIFIRDFAGNVFHNGKSGRWARLPLPSPKARTPRTPKTPAPGSE